MMGVEATKFFGQCYLKSGVETVFISLKPELSFRLSSFHADQVNESEERNVHSFDPAF